ncbi:MAG: GGDEF domain-containing protein [Hamadaea sp.]|uniref:GGDEF domain-containing protein n=1 Tax=Hamadaea sp. TaxID=2024425 RepID=UPI0017E3C0B6|nr:GGDEF domain-containing protein [Hamadaea sp.]NUR69987.1 GGDEF domain-containing protein [Hamadaea sp.]NUT19695.1 GGDEF domain-containing protein [Hamadaea sp.]
MNPAVVAVLLTGLAGAGVAVWLGRRVRRAEAAAVELRRKVLAERIAARQDSLTGLLNRRAFYELGTALLADPARQPMSAVLIDVDGFHRINNAYGQIVGDEVLVALGRRFADYVGGQLVARLGGDEFVALVRVLGDNHPDAARLEELLATPIWVGGQVVRITATVGVSSVAGPADLTRALRRAESMLRRTKIVQRRTRTHPSTPTQRGSLPEGSPLEQALLTGHEPRTGGDPVYCRTRVVAKRRRRH